MNISLKRALPLALALSALGVMMLASTASATHPRPLSAAKLATSFVPAFNACTSSNGFHGPPLGSPSCNPPVRTTEAIINGSNMVGTGSLKVLAGTPGPPEDSDVLININVTDVRCDNNGIGDSTACGAANATGGPDYAGAMLALATIRITDHWNAATPGGGTDTATVSDIPFGAVVGPCTLTSGDTANGSTCTAATSANAVVGGTDPAAKDGKRGVVEVSQIEVLGPAGTGGTPPGPAFLRQGIFIP